MRLFVLKSLRLPLPRRMGYDWNRCFYSWMNFVFNKVDYGRLEEIGPDKIAAEWVVRCGGSIRFQGYERWEKDYNLLPHGTQGRFLLTDIDASNTSITDGGLAHLGLKHLRTLNMTDCRYVGDLGLTHVKHVQDCLNTLVLQGCTGVTEKGLFHLHYLRHLKYLNVVDTSSVGQSEAIQQLKQSLPQCEIVHN
ncbi:ATP synthase subunit s, mitochondrial-like isoform X2 [Corticium candelabrum]|uniref:ATP synthase subunit s, mitochondrial-like isoform X2 n=1 Tax=Corticium candelabrum TaxID=121492 RepID=UPI002E275895|nr:ATP synthase subunit s, mitochondrial-like isoform X2 [Corticium candelabrum]